MTLLGLRTLLGKAVQRSDLASSYDEFLNGAIRDIQKDRSWTCMRTREDLTLANGDTSVALPDLAKELDGKKPVSVVLPTGAVFPIDLVSETEETVRTWSGVEALPRMFLLADEDGLSLNVMTPVTQDITLRVRYFKYLADLSGDSDTNWFTDNEWEMVLEKAKHTAFALVNDAQANVALDEYSKRFLGAARQDSYREVKGRVTRM